MKHMAHLALIEEPGRYYFRILKTTAKSTTSIGNVVTVLEMGKGWIAENTDEQGIVTRWQKELPDGKWTQVVGL